LAQVSRWLSSARKRTRCSPQKLTTSE